MFWNRKELPFGAVDFNLQRARTGPWSEATRGRLVTLVASNISVQFSLINALSSLSSRVFLAQVYSNPSKPGSMSLQSSAISAKSTISGSLLVSLPTLSRGWRIVLNSPPIIQGIRSVCSANSRSLSQSPYRSLLEHFA